MNYDTAAPPDWYATPEGGQRYWDGESWTQHYVPPPWQVHAHKSYSSAQWGTIIVLLIVLAIPAVMMGILGAVLGNTESGGTDSSTQQPTLSAIDDLNGSGVRDLGYGNSAVTLAVTNSSAEAMDYTFSVVATDRGVSPQAEAATRETIEVELSNVPPGETAQVDVVSTEGDPALRVFNVWNSTKRPSG